MTDKKDNQVTHFKHKEKKKGCQCKRCVCSALATILKRQHGLEDHCTNCYDLWSREKERSETIPFILQTPYGHPFFTWGKVGTKDCFVTVFFKVIKVDCKNNCALLQLLKPNRCMIDRETRCIETENICDVTFVSQTRETVLVDLSCYSAIKCVSPEFVKKETHEKQ